MLNARFMGVEIYFEDLVRAKAFYQETLGLGIADEDMQRYVKLDAGSHFICLERKGTESYPSADKTVLFFEVPDLRDALETLGPDRIVKTELGNRPWAVLHDPEGHNIVLLEAVG